jgi:hypothetical protein
MKKITFYFLLIFAISSCRTTYVSEDFQSISKEHQRIAILPFHIINNVPFPRGMSPREQRQIQESESIAFQNSLIRQLLKKDSQRKSKQMKVLILSAQETNSLLAKNGISASEAYKIKPQKLAKIIGVDAVVINTLHKNWFVTDFATFNIPVPQDIPVVIKGRFPINPRLSSRTYSLVSDIVNGDDGKIISSTSAESHRIKLRKRKQSFVQIVNRKISRNFPYLSK